MVHDRLFVVHCRVLLHQIECSANHSKFLDDVARSRQFFHWIVSGDKVLQKISINSFGSGVKNSEFSFSEKMPQTDKFPSDPQSR
jgi:hypothetical protein